MKISYPNLDSQNWRSKGHVLDDSRSDTGTELHIHYTCSSVGTGCNKNCREKNELPFTFFFLLY